MKTNELPIQAREICDSFVDGLQEILDANLLGVYMYGATVFPDCGQVQDIDCHVILETPPADNEKEEIRRLYETLSLRFPPRGGELLDAYYILHQDAKKTSPPRHLLQPAIYDESWALHCAHIRAGYYVTLHGPEPIGIFPPASWRDISAALDHELRYVENNLIYPAYCVLNLCRIMYSFRERNVAVSKRFGGRWACGQFTEWKDLIEAAMRSYQGSPARGDKELLDGNVESFLKFASDRINEYRADG